MTCKTPYNPSFLPLYCGFYQSPLSQSTPVKQASSLLLRRAGSFCLMAQCFSPYVGVLHVAKFLTYSRSVLTYHPSNNESIRIYSIMSLSCLLCIFPLSSLPQFSSQYLSPSVIEYIFLIHFIYYCSLPTPPQNVSFTKRRHFVCFIY